MNAAKPVNPPTDEELRLLAATAGSHARVLRGVDRKRYLRIEALLAAYPMDRDALAITAEESAEILSEVALGLAWAAGDAEPPRYCAEGCSLPHLGARANAAIHEAVEAAAAGTRAPPGVWHHLPELPPESAMVLVASSSWPHPVLCMHRGGRFLMEVDREVPRPFAWMPGPRLPERRP